MPCCLRHVAKPPCSSWNYKHYMWIGITLLVLATVISVLTLFLPYWQRGGGVDQNLYYCNGGSVCFHDVYGDDGWLKFVQVMWPILVAHGVAASCTGIKYVYHRHRGEDFHKLLPMLTMIGGLVAGIVSIPVSMAYRMGVFRKDVGADLHFCAHVISALHALFIVGGVWINSSAHCKAGNKTGDAEAAGSEMKQGYPPGY